MKTLGLIGGMSWESTVPYYRIINECVKERLGGLHSADIILHSVDFHDIERLQVQEDWQTAAQRLSDIACGLKRAGAEAIVICTNTMHKVAPEIEAACRLTLLHIADAVAHAIRQQGMRKVGLLGTRYTMEQDFYRSRIRERYGIEVIVPPPEDRAAINRIIYEELCLGDIRDASRAIFLRIIENLRHQGAEGIILGCTEIPLLINQQHVDVPLFDTLRLHAQAAAAFSLAENEDL